MDATIQSSLDTAMVAQVGAVITFGTPRRVAMQLTSTGAPSSSACVLEGSLDGTNFVPLATSASDINTPQILAPSPGMDVPVIAARANLTVLSGGTTPTVTALIIGYDS